MSVALSAYVLDFVRQPGSQPIMLRQPSLAEMEVILSALYELGKRMKCRAESVYLFEVIAERPS